MNPNFKRRALLLTGLSTIPGMLFAGDLLARRRLRTRCAIPQWDYQPHRFSDPVSEGSLKAVGYLMDGSGDAATVDSPVVRLKTFQMAAAHLGRDHCRISQVTVTITSDGQWILQLIAQQHPGELVEAQLRPQFERYQRNLFRVDIRPVGLMTLDHTEATSPIGKPEFPCIPLQQFWVLKEQTQRIHRRGESADLARFFNVISQVEIHFSYR
ncbi:MAG: hypothetical protein RIK87_30685 [Fuerstiella sp.]